MNRPLYVIYSPLKKGFFVDHIGVKTGIVQSDYTDDFTKAKIFVDRKSADEFTKEFANHTPEIEHHVLTAHCKL